MKKEKIYCFDFDGTLTTKDTLLEMIKFAKGKTRFLLGFLLYSPILVLMKLHLFPNWKAKQLIFKHFFGGMTIEDFDELCVNFAMKNLYLLRFPGIARIQEAQRKRERVFVVMRQSSTPSSRVALRKLASTLPAPTRNLRAPPIRRFLPTLWLWPKAISA